MQPSVHGAAKTVKVGRRRTWSNGIPPINKIRYSRNAPLVTGQEGWGKGGGGRGWRASDRRIEKSKRSWLRGGAAVASECKLREGRMVSSYFTSCAFVNWNFTVRFAFSLRLLYRRAAESFSARGILGPSSHLPLNLSARSVSNVPPSMFHLSSPCRAEWGTD